MSLPITCGSTTCPKNPHLPAIIWARRRRRCRRSAGSAPSAHAATIPASLRREEGSTYTSPGARSHRPYYVLDERGRPLLLELPFHFAIDDAMFFSFAWYRSGNAGQRLADTDRVFDLWLAAFQQQYRQAGYLNICLHPFVSGRALRIAMPDRLIAAMKSLPGVWFASCEEVARHCLAAYPAPVSRETSTSP